MRHKATPALALLFLAALWAALPALPAQAASAGKCLEFVRRGTTKTALARAKENGRCVALAAKGKLGSPPELAACLIADPRGKTTRMRAKALTWERTHCADGALPSFGLPDLGGANWDPASGASFSEAATEAAVLYADAMVTATLGEDPDESLLLRRPLSAATPPERVDPAGAKCQAKVLKTVRKCADLRMATFEKCAAADLRNGGDADSLVDSCIGESGGLADPTGKIEKLCATKLTNTIEKLCVGKGVAPNEALPGMEECVGTSSEIAACLDAKIECALCESLNAAGDMTLDCDLFDNGSADESCLEEPEPTPTPTPHPTTTPTPQPTATPTPQPTATPTPQPTATPTPQPTATPTPQPTATPTPTPQPTASPEPSSTPTPTTPTPTPAGASVDLEAFRPQFGAPGAESFQRRAVPDEDEDVYGVGIRLNGDDDDADGAADLGDPMVAGENDLIEVVVSANDPDEAVATLALVRTSDALRVWTQAYKDESILEDEDATLLDLGDGSVSIWVELVEMENAALHLVALASDGETVLAQDTLVFRPFNSIVMAFDGEFLTPTDPPTGINNGIADMSIVLHTLGWDAYMYDEDVVDAAGAGAAYDEIVSAVQERGVTEVALFGFSHGGGSVHDLLAKLEADGITGFTVPFTGYIDGISNASDLTTAAETRLPPGTEYHVNFYQRNIFTPLWIWGTSVEGSDVDVNVNNTTWGAGVLHISITEPEEVQLGILQPLVERVTP